jgi:hypothetical protein
MLQPPQYTEVLFRDITYRVYTVTYATNTSNREFCLSMTSAVLNEHRVNVLGRDRVKEFARYGLLDKLWALQTFLETISKSDDYQNVILFMDGYDTITLESPQVIVARFLGTKAGILFAAERGCSSTKWHMMERRNSCDDQWPFPTQSTPSPFLNSGLFIGFQRELSVLLSFCWDEYLDTVLEMRYDQVDPYVSGGDQQLIAQLFSYGKHVREPSMVRRVLRMRIDYLSDVFLCTYNMNVMEDFEFKHIFHPRMSVSVTQEARKCGHLQEPFRTLCQHNQNMYITSKPAVLHFNGRGLFKSLEFDYVSTKMFMDPIRMETFGTEMWVSGYSNEILWNQCGVVLSLLGKFV